MPSTRYRKVLGTLMASKQLNDENQPAQATDTVAELLADCYTYLLRQRQSRLAVKENEPEPNNSLNMVPQPSGNEVAAHVSQTPNSPQGRCTLDNTDIWATPLECGAIKVA
jgi:hypothetical protein